MSDHDFTTVLGLPLDVLEEQWATEEGPQPEERRVMQRCLILLGYPTGDYGQPGIDGEFGPNTGRALRQFQSENGRPATGEFDPACRAALYHAAAQWLGGLSEAHRWNTRNQLLRVEAMTRIDARYMIQYYYKEAARVPETLRSAFLALAAWANRVCTLPSLDLLAYLKNLNSSDPRTARLNALRYGFLQLPAAQFAAFPDGPARAKNPGDYAFHFDVLAAVLTEREDIRKAAESKDGERLALALPWVEDDCTLCAEVGLPQLIAELEVLLARTPETVTVG